MKKIGILNKTLSEVIALLGETDMIVVCDAGLPIPDECIRVDLALVEGVPKFFNVLEAILQELAVKKVILASEAEEKSPDFHAALLEKIAPLHPEYLSHEEFKQLCRQAKAVVRTGEFTPYANCILVCGRAYEA